LLNFIQDIEKIRIQFPLAGFIRYRRRRSRDLLGSLNFVIFDCIGCGNIFGWRIRKMGDAVFINPFVNFSRGNSENENVDQNDRNYF
jgi:hypothetical protein